MKLASSNHMHNTACWGIKQKPKLSSGIKPVDWFWKLSSACCRPLLDKGIRDFGVPISRWPDGLIFPHCATAFSTLFDLSRLFRHHGAGIEWSHGFRTVNASFSDVDFQNKFCNLILRPLTKYFSYPYISVSILEHATYNMRIHITTQSQTDES